MIFNKYYPHIIYLILFLIFSCTNDNITDGQGGSTETIGMIFTSDGTPAPGVNIKFIPTSFTPINPSEFDTTHSDINGKFDLSMLQDGSYNIMYSKSSLMAFHDSITILNHIPQAKISDTLKNIGSLKGVAKLKKEHDNQEIFIIIKGTNRYFQPYDTIGNFYIDSLAEGTYNISFITSYNNYENFDTTIHIYSNIFDTLSDTINLNFIGLPTPSNINKTYNNKLQIGSINWSPVSASNLAGYQISRRLNNNSYKFEVIGNLVTDTFYIDQTRNFNVLQGNTYVYRVCAIDSFGLSGKYSDTCKITYAPAFVNSNSLYLHNLNSSKLGGLVSDQEGKIFAVCSDTSLLYEVDESTFKITNTYKLPDNCIPYDITIMDDKTLMIAGDVGTYNIDKHGNKLWRYSVYTTKISTLNSQYLYYTSNSEFYKSPNMVVRLNTFNGITDTLFIDTLKTISSIAIDENKIYVLSNFFGELYLEQSNIDIYNPHQIFYISGHKGYSDFKVTNNLISILSNNRIECFIKKTMKKSSKFSLNEQTCNLLSITDNKMITLNCNGFINKIIEK